MSKKILNKVGIDFVVLSGSHYSGLIGHCIEVVDMKNRGLMYKLEFDSIDMWFSESEVKEF